MGQQIVHRLLISIPALIGVLFLCFCLLQVVPADPAMVIAGPDAKPETIAAIRQELGLTIGPTIELMVGAMLIAVPTGIALGTLAAVNRGSLADRFIMAISVAG